MKPIRLLAGLVVALSAACVHAQAYPNRSVRVIVPYPAGGATDVIARIVTGRPLAPRPSQPPPLCIMWRLGQPPVAEKRPSPMRT